MSNTESRTSLLRRALKWLKEWFVDTAAFTLLMAVSSFVFYLFPFGMSLETAGTAVGLGVAANIIIGWPYARFRKWFLHWTNARSGLAVWATEAVSFTLVQVPSVFIVLSLSGADTTQIWLGTAGAFLLGLAGHIVGIILEFVERLFGINGKKASRKIEAHDLQN